MLTCHFVLFLLPIILSKSDELISGLTVLCSVAIIGTYCGVEYLAGHSEI